MRSYKLFAFVFCLVQIIFLGPVYCLDDIVVKVVGGRILVNGTDTYIKGIGYSPVPPGDDLALPPSGDYFQSDYKAIWKRDMPKIQELGANLVRVWSWDFIADHASFLDEIYKYNISVMIPFGMSLKIYPDLKYPDIRNQALTDFEAFLTRYHKHPAIFGYMIGNELNSVYGEDLPYLFSLARDMIALRDYKNISRPITMPLASDSTLEKIVEDYYGTVDFDFWSIQAYSPESIKKGLSYFRDARNSTKIIKPIMLTEFGVDVFGGVMDKNITEPVMNETMQAKKLNDLYIQIRNNTDIVRGAIVMEWNDEWWKGDYPDSYIKGVSCPNLRYDEQNYCGNLLDNVTFIHEEFLGIVAQEDPTSLLAGKKYCITPRRPVCTLIAGWWRNDTAGALPETFFEKSCADVGLTGALMYLALPALFLIILLVIVEIKHCCRQRKTRARAVLDEVELEAEKEKEASIQSNGDIDMKKLKRFLKAQITNSFYRFAVDLDAFEVARMRVNNLIWNKLISTREAIAWTKSRYQDNLEANDKLSEEPAESSATVEWDSLNEQEKQLFSRMVAEVYYRYMEAYLLWREKILGKFIHLKLAVQETQENCIQWMDCLVLWNIVSQCSGTIAHSPEKVCQVFHFTKKYMQASAPAGAAGKDGTGHPSSLSPFLARRKSFGNVYVDISPKSPRKQEGIDPAAPQDDRPGSAENIIRSLMIIFERYYADVRTHMINYDDINQSGCSSSIKNITIDPSVPLHESFFTLINPELPVKEKKVVGDEEDPDGGKREDNETIDARALEKKESVMSFAKGKKGKGEPTSPTSPSVSDAASSVASSPPAPEDGSSSSKPSKKGSQLDVVPSPRPKSISKTVSFNPASMVMSPGKHLSDRRPSFQPHFKIVHTANSIKVITYQQQTVKFEESMLNINTKLIRAPEEPEPRYVKKWFPNRGGIIGCIVCFGWLIRLNLWFILLAKALNEKEYYDDGMDVSQLALADSAIALLICLLRFAVAGTGCMTVFDYIKLVWSLGLFGLVLISSSLPVPGFPMLTMELMPGLGIAKVYLVAAAAAAIIGEIRLNFISSPFAIPGRKDTVNLRARIQGTETIVIIVFIIILLVVQLMMSSVLAMLNGDIYFLSVMVGFKVTIFMCVILILAPVLAYYIGIGIGKLAASSNKLKYAKPEIYDHARAFIGSLGFWFCVFLIHWIFMYQILMPSVNKVDWGMCECKYDSVLQTSNDLKQQCQSANQIMCKAATILMWSTTILVSFVFLNAAFNAVLICAGVLIAVSDRVGNVKTWLEVKLYFSTIQTKCFRVVSEVLHKRAFYQHTLWNNFIESLYEEHLLSAVEKDRLLFAKIKRKKPVFNPPPVSNEAARRIIKFCWSLEAMLKGVPGLTPHRARYQVRTMPSWTVMVPCFTETSMYMQRDLIRPKNGSRISSIEYLQSIYPDEWVNLTKELRDGKTAAPQELLEDFLATPILNNKNIEELNFYKKGVCTPSEIEAICFWASFRGQTLVRTLKGLCNYRKGLEGLAMMEEGVYEMAADTVKQKKKIKEIQKMVRTKFQIIIANQVYNKNVAGLWTAERQEAFNLMISQFHDFDMVYNHSDDRTSCMMRFVKDGSVKEFSIARPGELVIGEPKAENQAHALPFALNEVIQVNDMNMYNSLENSYRTPFMLNTNFNTPEDWEDASDLIPRYRIIGYPEHTYTRPLSMVGDLMGSAEFCFVTITQRVLAALRVRAHYGHPDFLDGYWVRTRGGVSKASHILNTNEDIFSGYELFGRGEQVKYVEYLEQEKGRESSFAEAFTFEAKLARGAAQQIKSPHVYFLNERLPALKRLSLFYGSLGFYISNWMMAVTIDFYVFTILLFVGAGVTYHILGLLDAVIAVPWVIQIGYVLALPLLLELTIERGFWEGFITFLRRLLMGMIFFVFHVKTKSYFFAQGLLSGKGGYLGTGRGFGLDRRNMIELYKLYYDSHFNNAIILATACILYAIISGDKTGAVVLRLLSVLLVIFSWMVAPILFNPYPTRETQNDDVQQIIEWIKSTDLSISAKNSAIKDNAEAVSELDRKKRLGKWWGEKEQASWQAWYVKGVIEEWEAEDKLFKGFLDKFMLFLQKTIYLLWKFLPWLLLGSPLWHIESFYYFAYVIFVIIFFTIIDKRYSDAHENFTMLKLSCVLIVPSLITVFVYGDISFGTLIVCMILYFILAYMIWTELAPGFINNVRIKRFKKVHPVSVFPRRMKISNAYFVLQRLWPYVTTALMSVINMVTVMVCSSLTTLMYNGRVSDKWKRSHLRMRQENMFIDPDIMNSLNERNRSRSSSSVSSDSMSDNGDPLSGDLFKRELDGVREEVADQVGFLQDKIDELRFRMGAMKSAMSKIGSGGGGGGGGAGLGGVMMSAEELKALIEEKTKLLLDPATPAGDLANINIELERLYSSLESTQEYQDEVAIEKEARRMKNEPLNKAALNDMRTKYSEDAFERHPAIKERFESIPALRLIVADPSDIVKKHQNDWKLYTTNLLSLDEMRAICANLPKFGRNQLRQLAWVDALETRIEKVANGEEKELDKPIKGNPANIKSIRNATKSKGGVSGGKGLFDAIKSRGETPAVEPTVGLGASGAIREEDVVGGGGLGASMRLRRPKPPAGPKRGLTTRLGSSTLGSSTVLSPPPRDLTIPEEDEEDDDNNNNNNKKDGEHHREV